MSEFILPLEKMIEAFRSLPGVGRKSAERMAFGMLNFSEEQLNIFIDNIKNGKSSVRECSRCGNICEKELCPICDDSQRDHSIVCVVEDAKAVNSFEKIKEYRGTYHVLGGALSPKNGIGADSLNIDSLVSRVNGGTIKEVIVATNLTVEGETTAMYISMVLRRTGVRITRLASGIPAGADLEYADKLTLLRAIEGRRDV